MLAVLGADRSKDDDFVKLGEPYDPLVEQAFARITEAEPHDGNAVRLLKDAAENYPAWLDAIRSAENTILFENYIMPTMIRGGASLPPSSSGRRVGSPSFSCTTGSAVLVGPPPVSGPS